MPGRTRLMVSITTLAIALSACSGGTTEQAPTPPPQAAASTLETSMQLTSPAFSNEGTVPKRYTCDGADVSPPLQLTNVPTNTVSMVLIMDDPDAPVGVWDHWVAYDIEPRQEIAEDVTTLGTPGVNSWDRPGYGGPCPPGGTHRYFFTVYALDTMLGLDAGAGKAEVLAALEDHVLAQATLMGLYSR